MSDGKKYRIEVWDLIFFRVDEDGNEELNEDGTIKLYDCVDYDCSHLADGLDVDDLIPVKFDGGYKR